MGLEVEKIVFKQKMKYPWKDKEWELKLSYTIDKLSEVKGERYFRNMDMKRNIVHMKDVPPI